jgi:DNA topoisomerase-1
MHDGKYARLTSTAEVFDTGMNAAVVKLAEAEAAKGQRGGGGREPIAVLGAHPESGKEIKVMEGRYGPYVSDGATHATLPKSADPKSVTLDEAIALINIKAAKGPSKGKRKSPARKTSAKKKK